MPNQTNKSTLPGNVCPSQNHFKSYLIALIIGWLFHSCASELPPSKLLDGPAFQRNLQTAEWLLRYDQVRRRAMEVYRAETKENWELYGLFHFCFEDKGQWIAIFGNFEDGFFNPHHQYRIDSAGVYPEKVSVKKALTEPYVTAYLNTLDELKDMDSPIYILKREQDTLRAWLMSELQPKRFTSAAVRAVWYTFDTSGAHVYRMQPEIGQRFEQHPGDPGLTMDYSPLTQPPVSAITQAILHRNDYPKIVIRTATTLSQLVRGQWQHTDLK